MYISLEKELGLYFIATLLCKLSCLTTTPLFLCSITSLINNHLNLLFGTQGRPRRQSLFFPTNKRGLATGDTSQDTALFQSLLLSLDTPQS